jgi:hypothetical protein
VNIPIINDPNIGPEGSNRSCGSCFMCCTVLAIPELQKPAGKRCQHVQMLRGAQIELDSQAGGCCSIHAMKPERCTEFRCAWLDGWMPDEYRPDRIKGVVTTGDDGTSLIIHEHAHFEGVASRALKPMIDAMAIDGTPVFVVCGDQRKMIVLNPEVMADVQNKLRALFAGADARNENSVDTGAAPEETAQPSDESRGVDSKDRELRSDDPRQGAQDLNGQAIAGDAGAPDAGSGPQSPAGAPLSEAADPHDRD